MKHDRFRRLTGEQMVWTKHENTAVFGTCPVDGDEHVIVVWSDGHTAQSNAGGLNWAKHNVGPDFAGPCDETRTPVTHYSTCEPRFPELAKETEAKLAGADTIMDFLEWAQSDKGWLLAYYPENCNGLDVVSVPDGKQGILAAYFGIDTKKAEAERRQLLDEFVASQAAL